MPAVGEVDSVGTTRERESAAVVVVVALLLEAAVVVLERAEPEMGTAALQMRGSTRIADPMAHCPTPSGGRTAVRSWPSVTSTRAWFGREGASRAGAETVTGSLAVASPAHPKRRFRYRA